MGNIVYKTVKEFEILFVKPTIINMTVMQNFEVTSDKFNNTKSIPKLCLKIFKCLMVRTS